MELQIWPLEPARGPWDGELRLLGYKIHRDGFLGFYTTTEDSPSSYELTTEALQFLSEFVK